MTEMTRVRASSFGELPDGASAQLVTLESADVCLTVTSYGARVVDLVTRDRSGAFGDISLGYQDARTYATTRNAYFGATIGRVANRIAKGKFPLGGKVYHVPQNNGVNALHGGPQGFDQRNWKMELLPQGAKFTLESEDGDQGFPGTMQVSAIYLLEDNRITLRYEASADQLTVVNLTNHTYFNLNGEGSATILDHELTLLAGRFTDIDDTLIPTGELSPVKDSPFDFTSPRLIGSRIDEDNEQLKRAKGYDHNFVLRGEPGTLRPAARVYSPASGRVLEVATTEPGVQFYSGNFLDGSLTGKSGRPYGKRCAFCLETQHFPDSPNHPSFPSIELVPGQTYASETAWTFSHG